MKTPLMLGGATIAGLAGAAAVRGKMEGKRTGALRKRVNGIRLPKPGKAFDLGKVRKGIDFDNVASAAHRVASYGRQVGDVADAVERASKAAKKGQ